MAVNTWPPTTGSPPPGPHHRAAASARLAADAAARDTGRAALHGEAHQQVRDILAQRASDTAAGKAEKIRTENAARAEFITRRRGPR